MSRTAFAPALVAALMGSGITAGALLGAGAVTGESTTVVQQAPLGGPPARPVAGGGPAGKGLTARDIHRRDAPGVVFIRTQTLERGASPFDLFGGGGERQGAVAKGSGFVIDDGGYILTNAHVLESSTDVRVSFSDDARPSGSTRGSPRAAAAARRGRRAAASGSASRCP